MQINSTISEGGSNNAAGINSLDAYIGGLLLLFSTLFIMIINISMYANNNYFNPFQDKVMDTTDSSNGNGDNLQVQTTSETEDNVKVNDWKEKSPQISFDRINHYRNSSL